MTWTKTYYRTTVIPNTSEIQLFRPFFSDEGQIVGGDVEPILAWRVVCVAATADYDEQGTSSAEPVCAEQLGDEWALYYPEGMGPRYVLPDDSAYSEQSMLLARWQEDRDRAAARAAKKAAEKAEAEALAALGVQ